MERRVANVIRFGSAVASLVLAAVAVPATANASAQHDYDRVAIAVYSTEPAPEDASPGDVYSETIIFASGLATSRNSSDLIHTFAMLIERSIVVEPSSERRVLSERVFMAADGPLSVHIDWKLRDAAVHGILAEVCPDRCDGPSDRALSADWSDPQKPEHKTDVIGEPSPLNGFMTRFHGTVREATAFGTVDGRVPDGELRVGELVADTYVTVRPGRPA